MLVVELGQEAVKIIIYYGFAFEMPKLTSFTYFFNDNLFV